jgi:ubiquinone biosynthesis protein
MTVLYSHLVPPAAKTRIMLESPGPTYVKPGLIVSSQTSALPDERRLQLDRLQNEVRPVPYEAARQVITGELGAPPENELGAPPEKLYASFSLRPLAAASLGQVHHAVLAPPPR